MVTYNIKSKLWSKGDGIGGCLRWWGILSDEIECERWVSVFSWSIYYIACICVCFQPQQEVTSFTCESTAPPPDNTAGWNTQSVVLCTVFQLFIVFELMLWPMTSTPVNCSIVVRWSCRILVGTLPEK